MMQNIVKYIDAQQFQPRFSSSLISYIIVTHPVSLREKNVVPIWITRFQTRILVALALLNCLDIVCSVHVWLAIICHFAFVFLLTIPLIFLLDIHL